MGLDGSRKVLSWARPCRAFPWPSRGLVSLMGLYGSLSASMGLGFLWIPMGLYGSLWVSMVLGFMGPYESL